MPIPRRGLFVGPVVADAFESLGEAVYARQFEDYTSDCHCLHRRLGGCVDDLGLPPRGGLFVHRDGRRGVFVRRMRRHDPVSLRVVQTAVVFEYATDSGRCLGWALKCASLNPSS
ncbi:hypothetical protein SAMN05216371_5689 [Streptomyces sp. TLI_053]|uniref:hypothetical protein n=1 Tax=Streptomyces sp. TLI_053 TaxID=1855352 RepID=UPI00087AEEB1|nr:hypothetical protein [Streptomyces sp. TLI_053]SDT78317.1 hypothetical protein SAMN05216371_5689 [Streptomyces sp. TLI_053]